MESRDVLRWQTRNGESSSTRREGTSKEESQSNMVGMHLLQFSADQLTSFDTFEFVIHFHHKQLTVIGFSGSEASAHRDHRPTAHLSILKFVFSSCSARLNSGNWHLDTM